MPDFTTALPKAAVVYHAFPHYREGVLLAMLASRRVDYHFLACDHDPRIADMKVFDGWPPGRFTAVPTSHVSFHRSGYSKHGIEGGPLWQKGLTRLALRRDLSAIVYLGDPYQLSTWVSATVARLTGKHVLFWTIGWLRPESGVKALVRVTFLKIAHTLLLYGSHARQMAIEKGWSPERVVVVSNSLAFDEIRKEKAATPADQGRRLRDEWFGEPDVPVAICISRLTVKRRLDLLVDAVARLQAQGTRVNVLLVGEGSSQEALEAQAKEQGVKVRLHGAAYSAAELARCYSASAVSVCPGISGLTGVQSLAFGVPVVTHGDPWAQSPEFEAIQPPVTGALFKHEDVESLAECMAPFVGSPTPSAETQQACWDCVRDRFDPAFQCDLIDTAVLRGVRRK